MYASTTDAALKARGVGRATVCDAQADVPSTGWLRAQLAFKDSMVHGILQFTPSIAFRYVLHRCESRDIRCRESFLTYRVRRSSRVGTVSGPRESTLIRSSSLARFAPGLGFCRRARCDARRTCVEARDSTVQHSNQQRGRPSQEARPLPILEHVRGSFCLAGFDNDPSAGSPTETLLRLLLPLNDKVQWTSRDVAGSEPPTSPRSEHFTGPFNR